MKNFIRTVTYEYRVINIIIMDIIKNNTSECCGANQVYSKGIIKPDTDKWSIVKTCSQCLSKETVE